MVDITNVILTAIKNALPDVRVKSEYQSDVTETLPVVTILEVTNSTFDSTIDSSGGKHSNLAFEINIFTEGAKRQSQCKTIRNTIDEIITKQFGMRRDTARPIPNYADLNVYRYILRYSCIIDDNNKTIYRR